MYKYLYDRKQNKLNLKISNESSLLQIVRIPLTIAFALLTWSIFGSYLYIKKSIIYY
jgi:hypothetical protein